MPFLWLPGVAIYVFQERQDRSELGVVPGHNHRNGPARSRGQAPWSLLHVRARSSRYCYIFTGLLLALALLTAASMNFMCLTPSWTLA